MPGVRTYGGGSPAVASIASRRTTSYGPNFAEFYRQLLGIIIDHINDLADAHDADTVSVSPAVEGAAQVQAALAALSTNKASVAALAAAIATVAAEVDAEEAARIAADAGKQPVIPAGTYVDTTTDQTKAGRLTLTGRVHVREQWLDPTDPLFGGVFDNASHPLSERFGSLAAAQAVYPHAVALTDETDWAALQAAINHIGDTTTHRSGRISLPGWGVLNRQVTIDRKAVIMEGKGSKGVAGSSAVAAGSGLRAGANWPGAGAAAMVKLNRAQGSVFRRFRMWEGTTPANVPSAAFEIDYASGDSPPNTLMHFDDLWFGHFEGYEAASGSSVFVAFNITGADLQEDQADVSRCIFYEIRQAWDNDTPTGLQQVLWWFRSCQFWRLDQVANVTCQQRYTNCFSSTAGSRDFDISGGRLLLESFGSEGSKQLARMRGFCSLVWRDQSYFQITNNLDGDGLIIDAGGDSYSQTVKLRDSDFREANYTNPATPRIRVTDPNAGTLTHKVVVLEDVRYDGGPIAESHFDVDPGATAQTTVTGYMQGPVDASGAGPLQAFYNDLRPGSTTLSFSRHDLRTVAHRVVAQTLAADGAVTIDSVVGEVHAVTLNANATSVNITGTPVTGQTLTVDVIQGAAGGRTWAWPANCRFAGSVGGLPGPPPVVSSGAFTRTTVTFRWDAIFASWVEMSRSVGVL